MKKILFAATVLCMMGCQNKPTNSTPALDPSNMDTSVAPNESFYQYATGGWQKNNPLKPEYSRYGSFDILRDNNEKRINELFSRGDVDGIVITHGTDTMEETAFFLNLTVKSDKPVVLVGAMRPSTAMSADGPLNLYNAVVTAAARESRGKGVVIAMNGLILGAHGAMKTNTVDVQTFQSPNSGALGYVLNGKVFYNMESLKRHTTGSDFDVAHLDKLPKVGIVYSYSNVEADVMIPFLNNGYQGIIHAGVGNGNIHQNLFPMLEKARQQGILVVRSSRVPTGPTTLDAEVDDNKYQFVASQELNPQKARVLLMLALTKTKDWKKIQEYFNVY